MAPPARPTFPYPAQRRVIRRADVGVGDVVLPSSPPGGRGGRWRTRKTSRRPTRRRRFIAFEVPEVRRPSGFRAGRRRRPAGLPGAREDSGGRTTSLRPPPAVFPGERTTAVDGGTRQGASHAAATELRSTRRSSMRGDLFNSRRGGDVARRRGMTSPGKMGVRLELTTLANFGEIVMLQPDATIKSTREGYDTAKSINWKSTSKNCAACPRPPSPQVGRVSLTYLALRGGFGTRCVGGRLLRPDGPLDGRLPRSAIGVWAAAAAAFASTGVASVVTTPARLVDWVTNETDYRRRRRARPWASAPGAADGGKPGDVEEGGGRSAISSDEEALRCGVPSTHELRRRKIRRKFETYVENIVENIEDVEELLSVEPYFLLK
ncbi:hypothetical protein THAOC_21178 [Thalassiosira oceanica]|uniref:Uncharacterized protein n=1 Tax=Thalassiosira oceanica TaxID=159749 RepID=K0S061_THAOC|nr:hypothetical protein THAOC_21178 [Thalassiosira oceanica]|eukprot:EJK58675.1 hypothetical protein THAOC_21178 [Thalassiosira oceanica]